MNNLKFGDVLRDARERSGEDLMSVARRIRIRPDILERIEDSDLEGMPPRGYSRNMVNAYARYLGLNPTEVVKMYLDAQYNDQVERARANIRPAGFDMSGGRRGQREERGASAGASSSRRHGSSAPEATSRYSRNRHNDGFDNEYFDDLMPDSARRAVADRPRSSASTRRLGAVHVGSYNAYGQGLSERESSRAADRTRRLDPVDEGRTSRSTHRARRSSMPNEHYTNLYAAPSNLGVNHGGLRDKAPFIIAGVIILLLVVVIAFMASGLGRASSAETQQAEPINITGMPESSTSDDSSKSEDAASSAEGSTEAKKTTTTEAKAEPAEPAPEKVVMAYEVADGQSVYIEIYVDGDCVKAETITGPFDESYDVTGTFEFVASPPSGVTLTQDGKDVALEAGESGVASVEVDFKKVLAAWKKENSSTSTDSSSTSSTSTTAASDSSATSTSTSTQ